MFSLVLFYLFCDEGQKKSYFGCQPGLIHQSLFHRVPRPFFTFLQGQNGKERAKKSDRGRNWVYQSPEGVKFQLPASDTTVSGALENHIFSIIGNAA